VVVIESICTLDRQTDIGQTIIFGRLQIDRCRIGHRGDQLIRDQMIP